MISPALPDLRALYSFQTPIRLMPWGARAGPIGGAGLALPASICRRTIAFNFFATYLSLSFQRSAFSSQRTARVLRHKRFGDLYVSRRLMADSLSLLLVLQKIQLDRGLPATQRDHDPHFGPLHVDVINGSYEVIERPIDDPDFLVDLVGHFHPGRLCLHASDDLTHLLRPERRP